MQYLAKVAAFFNGLGPSNIKDGYNTDGTNAGTNGAVMSFEGPAATSAMPSGTTYANFMFQLYTRVARDREGRDLERVQLLQRLVGPDDADVDDRQHDAVLSRFAWAFGRSD